MRESDLRMQSTGANKLRVQLLSMALIKEEIQVEETEEIREVEDPISRPVLEGSCILWTGALFADGRGCKYVAKGKSMTASRWAYMERHGLEEEEIRGKVVSAVCFNKRCVNPKHLYLNGSPEWRFGSGSTNPNSKLTANDVSDIRRDYRKAQGQGVNNTGNANELMEKYGISRTHLSKITRRETWKHVV
tara:strand:+ start:872 stop:1441 length:570 start_codon:yes stop_codon:yes gene_type:complete